MLPVWPADDIDELGGVTLCVFNISLSLPAPG